ncbi:hypothetical protein Esti_000950 [Eimeria stiedai]
MTGDWCEVQKRLLIEESDAWFDRHGFRLNRLRLPLPLPSHCNGWEDIAAELERHPIHLKLLNHQRLLTKRMRNNWSYSASSKSSASDPRNKNLPFRLQPFPRSAAAELPQLSREILHEEFDGLLLTVHSKQLKPGGLRNSAVPSAVGVSKVFAGCLIESLASNERQLRAVWVNKRLSARSTRLLLQVLLPRAVVEAFALEAFAYTAAAMLQQQQQQQQQQARVQSFKSVFIDRRDLDIWPRQCWMLLPSLKNFGWPLHYDVKSKAATVHLDAGVAGSLKCSCNLTKSSLSAAEQASVDRFLMVTEPLMHLLLPLRSERSSLQIDKHPLFTQPRSVLSSPSSAAAAPPAASQKKTNKNKTGAASSMPSLGERRGWREFIDSTLDEELAREAACLVAGTCYSAPVGLSSADDEWCGLTSDDVLHLISDCEDVAPDEHPSRAVRAPQPQAAAQQQKVSSTAARQQKQAETKHKPGLRTRPSSAQQQTPPTTGAREGSIPGTAVLDSSQVGSETSPGGGSGEQEQEGRVASGLRRSSRVVKRS